MNKTNRTRIHNFWGRN